MSWFSGAVLALGLLSCAKQTGSPFDELTPVVLEESATIQTIAAKSPEELENDVDEKVEYDAEKVCVFNLDGSILDKLGHMESGL